MNQIVATDLAAFEALGRPLLLRVILGDIQIISNATLPMVNAIQAAFQLVGAVAYLYVVSKTAFALGVGGVLLAALFYQRRVAKASTLFAKAGQIQQETLSVLEDALRGAIQLKQNSRLSNAVSAYAAAVGQRAAEAGRFAREAIGQTAVFGQLMMYLLLYVMVWLLPSLGFGGATVARATLVLLFVLGALASLLQGVTTFTFAESAAEGVLDLEARLANLTSEPFKADNPGPASFEQLSFEGVYYQHASVSGDHGTVIGPLDFVLKRGEIVFLSGGNGAGKTTLIKLLMGLYKSNTGVIRLNGSALGLDDVTLREMLAVVFSDFHLPRRLWGVSEEDHLRLQELLIRFELETKVHVVDGAFTTQELSTGQRKRLALITSLLEKKPVLILDEFAADQDPAFRRRFYREILPGLREEGLTILAVSHDEDYFDVADRLLVMEYGRFLSDIDPGAATDII